MKRLVAFQRQDHRKIFGGVEVNQPVSPHVLIKLRSLFRVTAALFGFSTTIYKLVSSANSLTCACSSFTMSFM